MYVCETPLVIIGIMGIAEGGKQQRRSGQARGANQDFTVGFSMIGRLSTIPIPRPAAHAWSHRTYSSATLPDPYPVQRQIADWGEGGARCGR